MWCIRNDSISSSVCKIPHACDLNTVGNSWPMKERECFWWNISCFPFHCWSTHSKSLWCQATQFPCRRVILNTFRLKQVPYLIRRVRYFLTVPPSLCEIQYWEVREQLEIRKNVFENVSFSKWYDKGISSCFYLWISDILACTVKLSSVTIDNGTVGCCAPTGVLLIVSNKAAIGRVK